MKSLKNFIVVATVLLAAHGTARAEYFVTDLVDAAMRNDGHAVHRLIEAETDLAVTDPSGYTALHWAAVRGNWRIFEELVAAGAPVNAVGGDGGTPMHWACHHDRADMIQLLIDQGGDIGQWYTYRISIRIGNDQVGACHGKSRIRGIGIQY
jgi:ankyrin repeat protein